MLQDSARKQIYDISVPISPDMPIWPGNPGFERRLVHSISKGAASDVSVLTVGSHTGTHVDAPAHFLPGAISVDELSLDILVGKTIVFELHVEHQIARSDLEALELLGHERVLFKTKNSSLWRRREFTSDFVSFSPGAAQYLIDQDIKLVGIDYLSVGQYKAGTQVHHIFLEHGVVVIEGLDLSKIDPGIYELICLHLKILGADAAPARALLREV